MTPPDIFQLQETLRVPQFLFWIPLFFKKAKMHIKHFTLKTMPHTKYKLVHSVPGYKYHCHVLSLWILTTSCQSGRRGIGALPHIKQDPEAQGIAVNCSGQHVVESVPDPNSLEFTGRAHPSQPGSPYTKFNVLCALVILKYIRIDNHKMSCLAN